MGIKKIFRFYANKICGIRKNFYLCSPDKGSAGVDELGVEREVRVT